MINHSLKKLPKNTTAIEVNITWDQIQEEYKKAFETLQKELTVEGFRKGKAPQAIAEKNLPKEQVYEQLVKTLLPRVYDDILKKEAFKPIVNPRIELKKAKENEPWEFVITIAEKPQIDLKDYKKEVHEVNEKNKKVDIWVPGKDKGVEPDKDKKQQMNVNSILEALMKSTTCEIPELIIEEELNHRLSQLVDDVQKLGLTVDQYLKSKNTTIEDMKKKLSTEIEETYKMEFVLAEVAEQEKITVEQKDLEALFSNVKDEKERTMAQQNAYFYASILRKQKTLEFLNSL